MSQPQRGPEANFSLDIVFGYFGSLASPLPVFGFLSVFAFAAFQPPVRHAAGAGTRPPKARGRWPPKASAHIRKQRPPTDAMFVGPPLAYALDQRPPRRRNRTLNGCVIRASD